MKSVVFLFLCLCLGTSIYVLYETMEAADNTLGCNGLGVMVDKISAIENPHYTISKLVCRKK